MSHAARFRNNQQKLSHICALGGASMIHALLSYLICNATHPYYVSESFFRLLKLLTDLLGYVDIVDDSHLFVVLDS